MDPGSRRGLFLGRSEAIGRVLALLERAAKVDVPVLLTGETGTGKTHLARRLHASSSRSEGPFVGVNCAGIVEGLFESEFFGHCRGAFTGAVEARVGLFEEAHSGTLFLDEVGELPMSQQAKLLTALEERRVRPVGARGPKAVDVRMVAATSRDLSAEVAGGTFRSDLFHRLAVVRLELPPLRERPEDTRLLVEHLLGELGRKYRRPGLRLNGAAWEALLAHPWPGNVRELAHCLESSVILCEGRELRPEDLRLASTPDGGTASGALGPAPGPARRKAPTGRYSFFGGAEREREAIRDALVRCRGNRTRAARELGMSRGTLREKLRRYGLDPGAASS